MTKPEAVARERIDALLTDAGWCVQDADAVNLTAGRGIAVREYPLVRGHGYADYLLYVDGKAAGVIEAKKEGVTLTGVELQATKYSEGVPATVPAHFRPLPFLYQSTGVETRFTNEFDPDPRSRRVFSFHRPETLAAWLAIAAADESATDLAAEPRAARKPPTLRTRLQRLPPLITTGLWPAQIRAVTNLEHSLADDRPRALIQMATGSGKTFTAISSIYRLIKFADARRVLFLVDRANLGRQALKEFQSYATPDDGRKFTELYNVQLLTSNKLDPVARVVITTIQRLYSMLQGKELDPELEESSQFDQGAGLVREPVPVTYNPAIPVETFDFLFTDECHRSIYNLWRQVLEYFDAHLIGMTATPSKQTLGFFNQNLVMEYTHEQAVADCVNVDFDVYRIRTQITQQGSKVEAGLFVDKRDRESRRVRWEKLDEDLQYDADALDRRVVSIDQIRTVIRTFKEKLFSEIFPGRTEVPKTLIYAKDDSHADDIVQIVREEFGKGNDFAQKITYKTGTARIVTKKIGPDGREGEEVRYKSSGVKPEDLLQSFRNSYNPRIVVTVDMIATGTDIKPLEVVMFMRAVRSRNFFEQMKGRGVRVINPTDLQGVTPDAKAKTGFMIVDCVGVCEQELSDTRPLERNPTVPLEKLLQAVAFGSTDPDVLSSVAGRLARLDLRLGPPERKALAEVADGLTLKDLTSRIVQAIDPDRHLEAAGAGAGLPPNAEPTPEQIADAAQRLMRDAVAPIATKPELRQRLIALKQQFEQVIDALSKDAVIEAAFSASAKEKAKGLVESFEQFIRDHKDEITALQVLYSQPYAKRLRFADIKALAEAIQAPPRSWTPERLWKAYETLDRTKVRGSGGQLLSDIVSLVRFALHHDSALVPYADQVEERFANWLAQQETHGRRFTDEQRQWLELIRDHIAGSLRIEMDDFDYAPFVQRGGAGKASRVFGAGLRPLLDELNEALAA
ncbi:MAG TPA: type I restriction-modification enzyme R subunit C-terminal domain-containing protein [Candidatus Kryptonia bacterium]|nr:type I restriction-modification enzyme R subunit C-terminal domain-containing protein [Candidatus Kryptonia bacterium]